MSDSPKFKILPTDDDLNELERDLSFYPSPVTDPSALTASQVGQYNHEGYLKGLSILTKGEVVETRGYFDRLLLNRTMSDRTRELLIEFATTTTSGVPVPLTSNRRDYERRAGELIGLILAMPECQYQ